MTECQGCGAWNDASRTLCVLCGTPLAETDEWDAAAEPPPLPPLPDGGLRASMPTWLREPPPAAPSPQPGNEPSVSSVETMAPLGPRADPRTFLTDDDFPRWLRDLAARRATEDPPLVEAASMPPALAAVPGPVAPERAMAPVAHPAPAPATEVPPAIDTPRARDRRWGKEPWETLLLAALVGGVVVAALWALIANGVLRPGL